MVVTKIRSTMRIMSDQLVTQGSCRRRKVIISLTLLLFFAFDGDIYGQSQENATNQQFWIDFYPHYAVNEKLEYYGDTGYRTIANESWNRIYVRPSVRYSFARNWEIHGGLGFFYTFGNSSDSNQFEFRPWQGIKLNWPNSTYISFKNLVRIEERLSYDTSNWESSFDIRFRYKLSTKVVFPKSSSLKNAYVTFYGEIFVPVNDNIDEVYRNQGRAGIGLGYKVSKDWRFSLVWNWQKSRSGPNDEFHVSEYIYQLKILKFSNR